ncbi:MAG: hypothetical protein J7K49_01320 [Thaumarchaeota archaeon]|nr:hypothetical protein [Nitrososphaerota archaeon]
MAKTIQMRLKVLPENCRGCLACQLACSFRRHGVFNPVKSCIKIVRNVETEDTYPEIDEDCCNFCHGNPACVEACPYDAILFVPAEVVK